jgi:hypothetical protein
MYREVVTQEDDEIFMEHWNKMRLKWGFYVGTPSNRVKRFLLEDKKNNVDYGTLEITPFDITSNYSVVKPYFPDFYVNQRVIEKINDTYEIGKMCILEEYQNSGLLKNVFFVIYEHYLQTGASRYTCAMEEKLHHILVNQFRLQLEAIAEPKQFEKIKTFPIVFDSESMLQNPKLNRLLQKYQKYTQIETLQNA